VTSKLKQLKKENEMNVDATPAGRMRWLNHLAIGRLRTWKVALFKERGCRSSNRPSDSSAGYFDEQAPLNTSGAHMQDYATPQEIISAYMQLEKSELLIIHAYAEKKLGGTPYLEAGDLVHEALHRTLGGSRRWCKSIDFSIFITQTIKSISSAERKAFDQSKRADLETHVADAQVHHPSVEEQLLRVELTGQLKLIINEVREQLEGDANATNVLEGILSGLRRREIMEQHKMDGHTYDAARHRVMQHLANLGRRRL
jgi:hypothetical protein